MSKRLIAVGMATTLLAAVSDAQVPLDRADPVIIQRNVPRPAPLPSAPPAETVPDAAPVAATASITGVVRAITVVGQHELAPETFANAIIGFVGQELTRADLQRLASAIADAARAKDFPFANARIEPQALANGILQVTLDLGRIDAVRVLGARLPQADRILARTLVTGAGATRAGLERAIALVGDIPGVRVIGSRYVLQDGFGILLVTIAQDRASAYVQVDNRGSDEVGPVRSTLLASVRGVAQSADELALVMSQTPLQPSEFIFVRARYSAPIDWSGTVATVSGSVARSHPGDLLRPLDIVGQSADAVIGIQHPLLRSRARSIWASAELRAIRTDQKLAGLPLRRDRLVTLTGTTSGAARLAGGALRGEITAVAGLPIDGTTREGSALASRIDGDARFFTLGYSFDWTMPLRQGFSVVLASAGQVASRPLLATAEIGLGGPFFGRGYDYSERTGDNGALGSLEVRADVGPLFGKVIDRAQLFGFFDGGVVDNLRNGVGGGTLLSTGAGARIGTGRFEWLIEVAVPLDADRFDTGDRRPRLSLRVARPF